MHFLPFLYFISINILAFISGNYFLLYYHCKKSISTYLYENSGFSRSDTCILTENSVESKRQSFVSVSISDYIERNFHDLSRYLVFISLHICVGIELGINIRSALDIPKFIVLACTIYLYTHIFTVFK